MEKKIKFLVIDDHPLIRESMRDVLNETFTTSRVEDCSSVENALEIITPDLKENNKADWWILMDLGLDGISGLAAIRVILSLGEMINLITVSGNDDELHVGACFGAGVKAFISKGAPIEETINLIKALVNREKKAGIWLSADGYADSSKIKKIHLTDRQSQVLSMVCEGKTNKEISIALGITEITAKSHVSGIFRELQVVNRTQAVLVAQKLGVVSSKL